MAHFTYCAYQGSQFIWLQRGGLANRVLVDWLHIVDKPISWLVGENSRIALIIPAVWRGLPLAAVQYLAALQVVPEEVYEAANMDGANAWHRFRHVLLPHLKPILMVVTLFSFVQTMGDFQIVWLLTKGGPQNSTHLISTLSFRDAVQSGNIGQGAAVSLFLFPFLVIIIWLQLRALRKTDR